MAVNRDNLQENQPYFLHGDPGNGGSVLFSDGEHVGHISSSKDVS